MPAPLFGTRGSQVQILPLRPTLSKNFDSLRQRMRQCFAGRSENGNRLGLSDASNLLAHHRPHCDGRLLLDDGAGGRHDADAGMSRHGDRNNDGRGKETRAVSIGIIVNFTNRTVQGFGNPDPRYGEDFPVKITGANEVTISFQGERSDGPNAVINRRIDGSIDRVTGAVDAYSTSMNLKAAKIVHSTRYALKCRPAQRMF
jgi:hypothetical protein